MSIVGANSTIDVKRLETASNQESYTSTYHLQNIDCYIQPVDLKTAIILDEINAFHLYSCIIEGVVDIVIGDKIIDQDSNEYIVSGVKQYQNNIDTGDQTEIQMVKKYDKGSN